MTNSNCNPSYRLNDWENPELLHRNREYARASYGPKPLPQYLFNPEPIAFTVRLRPLSAGNDNPMQTYGGA